MNEITLKAAVRTEQGSKAAGRLRRAGMLPGVIKRTSGETTLIEIDAHAYMMAMRGNREARPTVGIELGDSVFAARLLEIQRDVISGEPIHVDFLEVAEAAQ